MCALKVNALNGPNLQRRLSSLMLHQAVFLILPMLKSCFSDGSSDIPETSENFYQATQHKILEDSHLDIRRPEKLISDLI
jgi:hypothetical protein